MTNERFLREFCISGKLDIHQDDVNTYRRYMFAQTQLRADKLAMKINLMHELELYSYINAGLEKIERLQALRNKFRGNQSWNS